MNKYLKSVLIIILGVLIVLICACGSLFLMAFGSFVKFLLLIGLCLILIGFFSLIHNIFEK